MITIYRPCPVCDGGGEVRHPLHGMPSCPEPTVRCDHCAGDGLTSATHIERRSA